MRGRVRVQVIVPKIKFDSASKPQLAVTIPCVYVSHSARDMFITVVTESEGSNSQVHFTFIVLLDLTRVILHSSPSQVLVEVGES